MTIIIIDLQGGKIINLAIIWNVVKRHKYFLRSSGLTLAFWRQVALHRMYRGPGNKFCSHFSWFRSFFCVLYLQLFHMLLWFAWQWLTKSLAVHIIFGYFFLILKFLHLTILLSFNLCLLSFVCVEKKCKIWFKIQFHFVLLRQNQQQHHAA